MDEQIIKKLEEQDKKIEAIFNSVEKTRKYILWTAIVTLALFVLPLIGLMFAVPKVLNTYTTTLENMEL